jgi:hypothetical protein
MNRFVAVDSALGIDTAARVGRVSGELWELLLPELIH